MKEILSPLNQTNNVTLVKKINSSTIIKLYQNFNIDVSKYFNGINKVSLYSCNKTGYCFFYPFNLSGDSEFYQHFQEFDWYYMPWKWEHEITRSYLMDGLSILEIGCAHGAFLEKINKIFDLKKIVGLELNESTKINNESWEILNQTIQDYSKKNIEQFDLVCSFQVLEHISDVHSFIKSSIDCLKVGGKLIISVPNNDSYIKHLETPLNMPPHHMGHWTESSLNELIKLYPIKLVKFHYEELMEYHVDGYINAVKYSNSNKFLTKVKRKFDMIFGKYSKYKYKVLIERDSILGHTILAVYEKTIVI